MHRLITLCVLSLGCTRAALAALDCAALKQQPFSGAHVTLAKVESAGTFITPSGFALHSLPPFCRVAILAKPSTDSAIQIEVWLPLKGWNGKLLGEGNGGFAGSIPYRELTSALKQGFAATSTDMGTGPSTPVNADELSGHPEKWKDWGFRATHVMTVAAKQIISVFYGTPPRFAYFRGCSTGGQQGLAEAQRFPEDYDGILSGAPAHHRNRLHMAILWNYEALDRGVHAGLTKEKLAFVHNEVTRSCISNPRGLLVDPTHCDFDPAALRCTTGKRPQCLNGGEIDAIHEIYAGPVDAQGHSIYPGLARGSEMAWPLPRPEHLHQRAPFDSIFHWAFGASWNSTLFDFDKDIAVMDSELGSITNATEPDLGTFQQLGHRLLLYHGWADPLIAPQGSIDYLNSVTATNRMRSHGTLSSAANQTEASVRLFMVPGMEHCEGGTGPNDLDFILPLQAWVEHGIAPDKIPAARKLRGRVAWTMQLRPFRANAQNNEETGIGNGDYHIVQMPPNHSQLLTNRWNSLAYDFPRLMW